MYSSQTDAKINCQSHERNIEGDYYAMIFIFQFKYKWKIYV